MRIEAELVHEDVGDECFEPGLRVAPVTVDDFRQSGVHLPHATTHGFVIDGKAAAKSGVGVHGRARGLLGHQGATGVEEQCGDRHRR